MRFDEAGPADIALCRRAGTILAAELRRAGVTATAAHLVAGRQAWQLRDGKPTEPISLDEARGAGLRERMLAWIC